MQKEMQHQYERKKKVLLKLCDGSFTNFVSRGVSHPNL